MTAHDLKTRLARSSFLRGCRAARQSWLERPLRERRVVMVGGCFLGIVLLWSVAIQPAIQQITLAQQTLAQLRVEAAQVAAIALEAQQLKATTPLPAAGINQPLPRWTDAQWQQRLQQVGLAAHVTVLSTPSSHANASDAIWTLNVEQAPAHALLDWLMRIAPTLGLTVQQLELQRSVVQGRERPGMVSGRIELLERSAP